MIAKSIHNICKNPELIENYKEAISDTEHMWECHHRLETHKRDKKNNTWVERPIEEYVSEKDLDSFDLYFDRPATGLIFLTRKEHNKVHAKWRGKLAKEGRTEKFYTWRKGNKNGFQKGQKGWSGGLRWYNNGTIEKLLDKCPEDWKAGRICKRRIKHAL